MFDLVYVTRFADTLPNKFDSAAYKAALTNAIDIKVIHALNILNYVQILN